MAVGLIVGSVVACCMLVSAGAILLIRERSGWGDILPSDEEKAERAERRRRRRRHSKRVQKADDSDEQDEEDDEEDDDDDDDYDEDEGNEDNSDEDGGKHIEEVCSEQTMQKSTGQGAGSRAALPHDVEQTALNLNTMGVPESSLESAIVLIPSPRQDMQSNSSAHLQEPSLLLLTNEDSQKKDLDNEDDRHEHEVLTPAVETDAGEGTSSSDIGRASHESTLKSNYEDGDIFEEQSRVIEKKPHALILPPVQQDEGTGSKPTRGNVQVNHGFDLD